MQSTSFKISRVCNDGTLVQPKIFNQSPFGTSNAWIIVTYVFYRFAVKDLEGGALCLAQRFIRDGDGVDGGPGIKVSNGTGLSKYSWNIWRHRSMSKASVDFESSPLRGTELRVGCVCRLSTMSPLTRGSSVTSFEEEKARSKPQIGSPNVFFPCTGIHHPEGHRKARRSSSIPV